MSATTAYGEQEAASDEMVASHQQTAVLPVVGEDEQGMTLNTFCLSAKGEILAGVGSGPGEIRVLDATGKKLRSWQVPVKPEAVGRGTGGTVLVAGSGKLLKYSAEGELLLEKPSPHTGAMQDSLAKIREQVVTQMKQRSQVYAAQVELYEREMEKLRQKDQQTEIDKRRLEAYERALKSIKAFMKQQAAAPDPTEEEIERAVAAATARKMRVASISTDGKSTFIATPATVGYGYDVWKLHNDLSNGTKIVTGLRGCCGQMDVQCNADGVFVAENSRHRVCRYDADGELVTTWGQRAKSGVTGFGSCCNPMNVAFGPGREVYTAESTTGRIKRYSPEGKLLGLVGSVDLVPGCKNVSIAVSDDGGLVFMLDMTRNHIVKMTRTTDVAADGE